MRVQYDPMADVVALLAPQMAGVARDVVVPDEGITLGFDAGGRLVLVELDRAQSRAPWLVAAAQELADEAEAWMGLAAASARCGVPEITLRTACRSGRLKGKKVAGHWLVRLGDVRDWATQRPRRGRPPAGGWAAREAQLPPGAHWA